MLNPQSRFVSGDIYSDVTIGRCCPGCGDHSVAWILNTELQARFAATGQGLRMEPGEDEAT